MDWILLAARRYLQRERGPLRFRLNYGGGYETLVLLDGAELDNLQLLNNEEEVDVENDVLNVNNTSILCIQAVIAHQDSEKTQQGNDTRPDVFGIVAAALHERSTFCFDDSLLA